MNEIWRWAALSSLLLNISFSYSYQTLLPAGQSPVACLFTPAPYALLIWGLIYAGLLAYSVQQLRRPTPGHTPVAVLLTAFNCLSMAWVAAYSQAYLAGSMVLMLTMVSLCGGMYALVHRDSGLASTPFRVLTAWMSVATAVNLCVWLNGRTFEPALGEDLFVATLVIFLTTIGGCVLRRYGDRVFPLVVGWGTSAVAYNQVGHSLVVAWMSLLATQVLLAGVLWHSGVLRWETLGKFAAPLGLMRLAR